MPEYMTYDNLFAGNTMAVVTEEIVVAESQTLEKGAVFEKDVNGHAIVPTGSPPDPTKAYGIMAESVTTQAGETKTSVAYVTGEFNIDKIVFPSGGDLDGYKDALRKLGIFLKDTVKE